LSLFFHIRGLQLLLQSTPRSACSLRIHNLCPVCKSCSLV